MTTLEHLNDAIESLREAQEEAGMGTGMMLSGIIDDLQRLTNRLENIQDGNESEEGR